MSAKSRASMRATADTGSRRDFDGWERLHTFLVWMLASLSLAIGFWGEAGPEPLPTLVYSSLAALGLIFSSTFRVVLFDTLNQFQYREKFLLFLFHLGVMGIPTFFGLRGWTYAAGAVLVLLSFQAVTAIWYGRVVAFCALVALPAFLEPPFPPDALAVGWFALLLLAYRAEFIRFRLEAFAPGGSLSTSVSLRETLQSAAPPVAAGLLLAAGITALTGSARQPLSFDLGDPRYASEIGTVSFSDVLFDAIMIVGLIIATLVALNWIEKKLRRNKKGDAPIGEEIGGIAETRRGRAAADLQTPSLAEENDPRGRVLGRFRLLAAEAARLGVARIEGEPAGAFLSRFAGLALGKTAPPQTAGPPAATFNRACYSREEITESEAQDFARTLDRWEPAAREALERRQQEDEESTQSESNEDGVK